MTVTVLVQPGETISQALIRSGLMVPSDELDIAASILIPYTLPDDMRKTVQAVADALGKRCYVALMSDGALVVTDDWSQTKGARRDWVFHPSVS